MGRGGEWRSDRCRRRRDRHCASNRASGTLNSTHRGTRMKRFFRLSAANVKTPTPFGFGGWIAMTKGTGGLDVMMGDLVLTKDEVNPVMPALLDNGLEVTALHNHF